MQHGAVSERGASSSRTAARGELLLRHDEWGVPGMGDYLLGMACSFHHPVHRFLCQVLHTAVFGIREREDSEKGQGLKYIIQT